MKSFLALFLVVLIGTISADATKRMSNIVGGTNATTNQFPFMVSLTIGSFGCGGFLLTPTHVGTAAHCFEANTTAASITAQVGTNDISSAANGQTRGASSFNIHPLYNNVTLAYDAAIITLSSPFTVDGTSVRIAPTATNNSQLPSAGTTVYVAGWGNIQTGGPSSDNLLFVGLPYVNLSTCSQTYGTLTTNVQICAGGVVGKDSCQGDSGGPLFTTANPSNPTDATIIGIVSFGGNSCAVNEPGVYADVPGFANSFFQSIITQSASGIPSSGAVASSSGAVVASSSGAVASSSGVVASSSGAVVASSSGAVVASSSGAVASSSGAVVASSSRAVVASSSRAFVASSSGAVVASSVVAASSSGAVAASSVVAASKTATTSQSATPSGSPPESSGFVAASSVAKSSGAAASASTSKVIAAKTKTGLAAITCRQTCQLTFRQCKKTTRKIRTCKKAKKSCVSGCGIVNPNRA